MIAFGTIKERKVVHWAIAYVGAAWCVLQVMEVLETPLGVTPAGWLFAGIVMATGSLVTLILAWYHGETIGEVPSVEWALRVMAWLASIRASSSIARM
jgi:hypothetical protein